MSKRRQDDWDDGFDEGSNFDDDEVAFERIQRRREQRPPARLPKDSRDNASPRSGGRPNRRRDLASLKAWGTPY